MLVQSRCFAYQITYCFFTRSRCCRVDESQSPYYIALDQARQRGKKTKNGVKYEKYRRTKRAQRWPGEGERAPPFTVSPPQTTHRLPLGSLRSSNSFFRPSRFFFLFPPMRSLFPGYYYNAIVFRILIRRIVIYI